MKKKIESQGTVSMDSLCFGGRYRNHVSFLCYNGENQSVYWMMGKNMNLLLLIFTFITNWIVSASFWALYFLFTVPFFHEELAGNYELLTERILQLSLACVLVPAVLSGTGVMQYFFVRENGGRRAAGETKAYLERLMCDICRRGRLELSDFRLYTAKADDYNAWAIGGNHITVTERLLHEFSEEEVKGILAHEVGHLQNGHSRFGLLRCGMEWFSGIIVYVYSMVTLLLAFLRWIPVLGVFYRHCQFFYPHTILFPENISADSSLVFHTVRQQEK